MTNHLVLEWRSVVRRFQQGHSLIEVLNDANISVQAAERLAIVGASGSGKTTLLQIMGGLDQPTAGEVFVNGQSLAGANELEKGKIRNRYLCFVYQFHHLLPEFTSQENVALPLLIRRIKKEEAMGKAGALLSKVGLGDRLSHKPSELSGGERQRTAIARALITNPKLVLADEPTGNLDAGNSQHVIELMLALNLELETSLVIVTHDESIASKMDRVLRLENGRLSA